MNAALAQHDREFFESYLENPDSYNGEDLQDVLDNPDGVDRVKCENADKTRVCPDANFADLGYRVPLAMVLRKVTSIPEKTRLLETFFRNYSDYIHK